MGRNTNELMSCFVGSGVTAKGVVIDSENRITVDSLKYYTSNSLFKVDTTLISLGNIDVRVIDVKGDLICKGYMNATKVSVRGNLICNGDANMGETLVIGDFNCHGNMTSNGHKVIVHGDLLCEGNCDADVVVQGNFTCKGEHTGKYMPMG